MSTPVSQAKQTKYASTPTKVIELQRTQTDDGLVTQEAPLAAALPRFANTATVEGHAQLLRQAGTEPSVARAALLQSLQGSYGNAYVQRVLAVARKAEDEQEVTPDVEASIRRAKGNGQALDQGVRRQMEESFGSDLSHVRVHTDGEADNLNQALSARAFTVGGDIFFRQGAYNPGASSGRELIAHEMTHVVQQGQGQVRAKLTVNQPGDKFEQEADSVAKAVIQAEQVAQPTTAAPQSVATRRAAEEEERAQPQLQRQPEEEEEPVQRQSAEEEETAQRQLQRQSIAEEDVEDTAQTQLQRQSTEEEEGVQAQIQRQVAEEEEAVQTQIQRQPVEEEEAIQTQRQPEEDEAAPVQTRLQRQVDDEEQPVQAHLQRQAEEKEESLQRQPEAEKEDSLQRQPEAEDEQVATALQRQSAIEEETPVQGQRLQRQPTTPEEDAETAPMQRLQRVTVDEQESVQAWSLQRQADKAEEDALQPAAVQRQPEQDEETAQAQLIQRQAAVTAEEKPDAIQTLSIQRKSLDEAAPAAPTVGAPALTPTVPTDHAPTAAEKAEARAKAAAARARAAQANQQGATQTERSRAGQAAEQSSGQTAQQKAATLRAAAGKKAGQTTNAGNGGGPDNAEAEAAPAPLATETAPALNGAAEKAPASPAEDPAFQAVIGQVKGVAAQERRHAPAATKAKEAQAAAESPASEVAGKAQSGQVEQMAATETPGFDAAAFKAKLLARIQALTPQTAADADEFKEKNRAGELRGELQSETAAQQAQAQAPLATATNQAPDTSNVEPKPVTPLQPNAPGEAPVVTGAAAATPKPKGQGEVEAPLQAQSQQLDQQMAAANISEEQLVKSNEPEFQAAATARQESQSHAQRAPQAYRQDEQGIIGGAQAAATATVDQQSTALHADRAGLLAQVDSQQVQGKSADEQKRAEVGAHIQGIYAETKSKVESILSSLDGEVEQLFTAGAESAKQAFENYVDAAMEAYKEERYGGWLGWAQWVADKFQPTQPEVLQIFAQGRQTYIEAMSAVIDNVVALIGSRLAAAKAEIANGKQRIQEYVGSLPADLQQVGQEAAQTIQSQFDELSQSVDAKQESLIDNLAEQYNKKLQEVDGRIEQLKAENQTLYDIAADKIGGVIKTILELKDMLLGALSRAAAAISQIIADPIGFLGNLIDGVKQGLANFVSNVGQHLKEGLITWLTGAVSAAGIALPQNWDLPGIFQLVMQLLGLTFESLVARLSQLFGVDIMSVIEPVKQIIELYQAEGMAGLIKAGLARLIGEERMAALLEVWQMIQSFISGSWEALWGLLQEYLGGLKELVFGKLEEFLTERVVKAGVTWLVSLLNPASAFIKACKAIYDIVMFFVERASQIGALVNALIDSISAVAGGSVGAAAAAIEKALAKGIPVAIGFLSSLLGLGNVSEKVQEIIQGVRGLVDKGLNAIFNSKPVQMVVGFIKKTVKKITESIKRTVSQKKTDTELGPNSEQKAVDEAAAKFKQKDTTPDSVQASFPSIEKKYQIKKPLRLVAIRENTYVVQTVRSDEIVKGEIKLTDNDILSMVREIAINVYNDRQAKEAQQEIRDTAIYDGQTSNEKRELLRQYGETENIEEIGEQRKTDRKRTIESSVFGGAEWIGNIREMRTMGKRFVGTTESKTVGVDEKGKEVVSMSEARLPRFSFIQQGIAPVVGGQKGPSYPKLAKKLQSIPGNPMMVAKAILYFISTGSSRVKINNNDDEKVQAEKKKIAALSEEYKETIAEVADTLISAEGMRSPSAIVTSAMILELMASENDPARKDVSSKGVWYDRLVTKNPMKYGENAADQVNMELGYHSFKSKPSRSRQYGRSAKSKAAEIQLVADFVKTKAHQQSFDTLDEVKIFIEKQVRKVFNMHDGEKEISDLKINKDINEHELQGKQLER